MLPSGVASGAAFSALEAQSLSHVPAKLILCVEFFILILNSVEKDR